MISTFHGLTLARLPNNKQSFAGAMPVDRFWQSYSVYVSASGHFDKLAEQISHDIDWFCANHYSRSGFWRLQSMKCLHFTQSYNSRASQ